MTSKPLVAFIEYGGVEVAFPDRLLLTSARQDPQPCSLGHHEAHISMVSGLQGCATMNQHDVSFQHCNLIITAWKLPNLEIYISAGSVIRNIVKTPFPCGLFGSNLKNVNYVSMAWQTYANRASALHPQNRLRKNQVMTEAKTLPAACCP